ncbi:MAG: carbohydrate porin [Acidobacteria bacterium]|nr:carbohydrate porin [Acidobacteriota bacterium]
MFLRKLDAEHTHRDAHGSISVLRSGFTLSVLALLMFAAPATGQAGQSLTNLASGDSGPHPAAQAAPCKDKLASSGPQRSRRQVSACLSSARKTVAGLPRWDFNERLAESGSSASPAGSQGQDGAPKLTAYPGLSGRFWLGGQANVIAQGHGAFHALYSGPHSFHNYPGQAVTSIEDLFTGARVSHNFEVLFDMEDVRGQGLSSVLGLAGFTDLDAQRAPSPGVGAVHTYMSRLLLHYIVPLGGDPVSNTPSYLELASSLPARRFEIYFGKFSLADFFDHNAYANDDHSQFLNWTVDQNGAWDYAADTAGYTYGAYLEFDDQAWSVRFAEVLMTHNPNGRYLSLHLSHTKAENAQIDWAYSPSTFGKVRLLGYVDQARMGSFANALAAWRDGLTPVPDVNAVRQVGAHEYGFGLNWEQGLPHGFGLFARAGWNNGKFESYSYTEVNNTFEGGFEAPGALWGRPADHVGVAFVSNGISREHQAYLAAGGLGFMLGDGALTYGREQILEAYYNLRLPIGFSIAPDIQYVRNPGYNQVRGPVVVFGMRLHLHLGFHQFY